MEKPNTNQFLNYQNEFDNAANLWEQFASHIEKYCGTSQIVNGHQRAVPAVEADAAARTILVSVAGVDVVCKFAFFGEGSAILFGYNKVILVGLKKFREVSRRHFNGGGSFKLGDASSANSAYCVQDDRCLEGIFFPECLKVLESVWSK